LKKVYEENLDRVVGSGWICRRDLDASCYRWRKRGRRGIASQWASFGADHSAASALAGGRYETERMAWAGGPDAKTEGYF
jgi:hypothetical protein